MGECGEAPALVVRKGKLYSDCECTSRGQHAFMIMVGMALVGLAGLGFYETIRLAIYVARHLCWR